MCASSRHPTQLPKSLLICLLLSPICPLTPTLRLPRQARETGGEVCRRGTDKRDPRTVNWVTWFAVPFVSNIIQEAGGICTINATHPPVVVSSDATHTHTHWMASGCDFRSSGLMKWMQLDSNSFFFSISSFLSSVFIFIVQSLLFLPQGPAVLQSFSVFLKHHRPPRRPQPHSSGVITCDELWPPVTDRYESSALKSSNKETYLFN